MYQKVWEFWNIFEFANNKIELMIINKKCRRKNNNKRALQFDNKTLMMYA